MSQETKFEHAANTSFDTRVSGLERRARTEVESGALHLELPGAMELAGLDEDESFNPATEDSFMAKLEARLAEAA